MSFKKIRNILRFTPHYTIADGAREVWNALENGIVDPDDPRTITVKWYKHLIESDSKFL